jgi:hypothetical protein
LSVGVAGFGFADLVDELAWPACVEDVEEGEPVALGGVPQAALSGDEVV